MQKRLLKEQLGEEGGAINNLWVARDNLLEHNGWTCGLLKFDQWSILTTTGGLINGSRTKKLA
jgi:hypothetical protein